MEIALRQPHQATLEVEQCQRKQRDPTIMIATLVEEALRGGDITSFGVQHSQSPDRVEIGAPFRGLTVDREGGVIASNRLEDGGALGVHNRRICP